MSRYAEDVAKMDRRHRRIVKCVSFFGAALVIAGALWSAGVVPGKVFETINAWFSTTPSRIATLPPSPPSMPVVKATGVVTALPPGTESSVSPVELPLYLISTMPGRNLREGSARLGVNPEFPQTFVAGATLANGTKLVEIYRDRVTLERGNQRFELYVGTDKNMGIAKRGKGSATLAMVGGQKGTHVEAAPAMPPDISNVIRSMARYENDHLIGLELFPGEKSYVFSQLGLKPGDVIVAIDGAPITDPNAATRSLQDLLKGSTFTVTVNRSGAQSSLALDGAIVAKSYEQPTMPNQATTIPMPTTG